MASITIPQSELGMKRGNVAADVVEAVTTSTTPASGASSVSREFLPCRMDDFVEVPQHEVRQKFVFLPCETRSVIPRSEISLGAPISKGVPLDDVPLVPKRSLALICVDIATCDCCDKSEDRDNCEGDSSITSTGRLNHCLDFLLTRLSLVETVITSLAGVEWSKAAVESCAGAGGTEREGLNAEEKDSSRKVEASWDPTVGCPVPVNHQFWPFASLGDSRETQSDSIEEDFMAGFLVKAGSVRHLVLFPEVAALEKQSFPPEKADTGEESAAGSGKSTCMVHFRRDVRARNSSGHDDSTENSQQLESIFQTAECLLSADDSTLEKESILGDEAVQRARFEKDPFLFRFTDLVNFLFSQTGLPSGEEQRENDGGLLRFLHEVLTVPFGNIISAESQNSCEVSGKNTALLKKYSLTGDCNLEDTVKRLRRAINRRRKEAKQVWEKTHQGKEYPLQGLKGGDSCVSLLESAVTKNVLQPFLDCLPLVCDVFTRWNDLICDPSVKARYREKLERELLGPTYYLDEKKSVNVEKAASSPIVDAGAAPPEFDRKIIITAASFLFGDSNGVSGNSGIIDRDLKNCDEFKTPGGRGDVVSRLHSFPEEYTLETLANSLGFTSTNEAAQHDHIIAKKNTDTDSRILSVRHDALAERLEDITELLAKEFQVRLIIERNMHLWSLHISLGDRILSPRPDWREILKICGQPTLNPQPSTPEVSEASGGSPSRRRTLNMHRKKIHHAEIPVQAGNCSYFSDMLMVLSTFSEHRESAEKVFEVLRSHEEENREEGEEEQMKRVFDFPKSTTARMRNHIRGMRNWQFSHVVDELEEELLTLMENIQKSTIISREVPPAAIPFPVDRSLAGERMEEMMTQAEWDTAHAEILREYEYQVCRNENTKRLISEGVYDNLVAPRGGVAFMGEVLRDIRDVARALKQISQFVWDLEDGFRVVQRNWDSDFFLRNRRVVEELAKQGFQNEFIPSTTGVDSSNETETGGIEADVGPVEGSGALKTLNPQPSTLNPHSSTLNPQSSTTGSEGPAGTVPVPGLHNKSQKLLVGKLADVQIWRDVISELCGSPSVAEGEQKESFQGNTNKASTMTLLRLIGELDRAARDYIVEYKKERDSSKEEARLFECGILETDLGSEDCYAWGRPDRLRGDRHLSAAMIKELASRYDTASVPLGDFVCQVFLPRKREILEAEEKLQRLKREWGRVFSGE